MYTRRQNIDVFLLLTQERRHEHFEYRLLLHGTLSKLESRHHNATTGAETKYLFRKKLWDWVHEVVRNSSTLAGNPRKRAPAPSVRKIRMIEGIAKLYLQRL